MVGVIFSSKKSLVSSRTIPPPFFILAFFTGTRTFIPVLFLGYGLQRIFFQQQTTTGALFFLFLGSFFALFHIARVLFQLSLLRTGAVTRAGASLSVSQKASGTKTYHVHALYDDAAQQEHDISRVYSLRLSAQEAVRIPAVLYRPEKPTRAILLGELHLPLIYTSQNKIAPLSSGVLLFVLQSILPFFLAILLVLTVSWIEHIAHL